MKSANELITKPSAERPFQPTPFDVDLVDYIFHKILMTWGKEKYHRQFGTDEDLENTKRDWAKDLTRAFKLRRNSHETEQEYSFRAKMRVDDIFTEIRLLSENGENRGFQWPQLKLICSHINNYSVSPAHKPFKGLALPNKTAQERAKAEGEKTLEQLKSLFPETPKPKEPTISTEQALRELEAHIAKQNSFDEE